MPAAALLASPLLAIGSLSDLRGAAADASLFLLVGGLVMLTVICLLVFVQNLLPERAQEAEVEPRRATRRLRALDGGPLAQHIAPRRRDSRGRRRPVPLAPVDLALDRVVELRLGEPRLLRAQDRFSHVRLYGCRGCTLAMSASAANGAGCTRERAALEEIFAAVLGGAVRAQESSCRRRGDAACEFEVAH